MPPNRPAESLVWTAPPTDASHLPLRAEMIVSVVLLALPILYVALVVRLLVAGERASLLPSVAVAVGTASTAMWAILQSRSSTAGIGIIFIPSLSALAGSLALPYVRWRRSPQRIVRLVGVGLLALACVPLVVEAVGGRRTVRRNAERDADASRRERAVTAYREELARGIARRESDASTYVDSLVRSRSVDRELVLAALQSRRVSPELLDSLADSPDLGVALEAVRSDSAPPATLARVYRTHPSPSYFFQALAANPHTPAEVLRDIYRTRPAPIAGLDIWFAGNDAAPSDLLLDIARRSESIDAIRALLRNRAVSCAIVDVAATGPAVRGRAGDLEVRDALRDARVAHC